MELVEVDVVKDILKSQFGYSIDSEIASKYLETKILLESNEILFLFDFRKVIFDHYFARAFGPLFMKISNSDVKFDVVFRMENFQIEDFLLGLIDYLNIEYSIENDGKIDDFFIEKNFSLKIINKENEVSFISKRCSESDKILSFINQKLETNFDELYHENLVKNNEDISPRLQELLKLRCIYKDSKNKYYSIYKYLNNKK